MKIAYITPSSSDSVCSLSSSAAIGGVLSGLSERHHRYLVAQLAGSHCNVHPVRPVLSLARFCRCPRGDLDSRHILGVNQSCPHIQHRHATGCTWKVVRFRLLFKSLYLASSRPTKISHGDVRCPHSGEAKRGLQATYHIWYAGVGSKDNDFAKLLRHLPAVRQGGISNGDT